MRLFSSIFLSITRLRECLTPATVNTITSHPISCVLCGFNCKETTAHPDIFAAKQTNNGYLTVRHSFDNNHFKRAASQSLTRQQKIIDHPSNSEVQSRQKSASSAWRIRTDAIDVCHRIINIGNIFSRALCTLKQAILRFFSTNGDQS